MCKKEERRWYGGSGSGMALPRASSVIISVLPASEVLLESEAEEDALKSLRGYYGLD